jgi:hypothetical protein
MELNKEIGKRRLSSVLSIQQWSRPVPSKSFTYLLNYLRTKSLEQSRVWEGNRFSPSQEIPILWNLKFRYRIHNYTLPDPIQRQINPVCVPHSTS